MDKYIVSRNVVIPTHDGCVLLEEGDAIHVLDPQGKPVEKKYCKLCKKETDHRYEGKEKVDFPRPHLWSCMECGTTSHHVDGPSH